MLEKLYPILILIGATIGLVLAFLWRQGRSASNLNLSLIRLNEQLQFDTPTFLQSAWPLLAQSGLRGIKWQLDWFGVPLRGESGSTDGTTIVKEITVAEMKLVIHFQQSGHTERRYFDEALIETFLLLLRTDMWIKAGAIDATFSQMAKLTLFLQHDMKNVAQFIQLMADQLAAIPAGKEQQVLDYLRVAAPLIRHRADRIVRTLTVGQPQENAMRVIDLREEITQIAGLYRLDYILIGDAQVTVPEHTLDSALNNIFKNYSDITLRDAGVRPLVTITIADDGHKVAISVSASGTAPVEHVERLFEPFWSSDPSGLGIGLYQAKQMLELCRANIRAAPNDMGQLQFDIEIKK